MSIKVGSFKDETAKAFRGFTLQTSTRASSQTLWRGEFTAPPDPQLNWTPSCPKAFTIAQIIVCNSKMLGAQAIAISTTEIFPLLTSFALILQIKFSQKFSKSLPLFVCLVLPWLPVYKNSKTILIKTFCFMLSNMFFSG